LRTRGPKGAASPTRRTLLLVGYTLVALWVGVSLFRAFPNIAGDFLIQVTAGRVAELDGARSLYDLEVQSLRQAEIRGVAHDSDILLPFNHPPFLLPALRPLSTIDLNRAFAIWTIASFASFVLSIAIMTDPFRKHGASRGQLLLVGSTVLAFFPVWVALFQGQDTGLLVLGVAAWLLLFERGKDFQAGIALCGALIRPHMAIGLALPFLFARRRVLSGFVAGSLVLLGYAVLLTGPEFPKDLVMLIRETSLYQRFDVGSARMLNLKGTLSRLNNPPPSPVLEALSWSAWLVFLGIMSRCWSSLGDRVSVRQCSLLVAGTVFLVPHIHMHDAAICAVPAVGASARRFVVSRSDWDAPVMSLAVASLLLAIAWMNTGWVFSLVLGLAIAAIFWPLVRDFRSPIAGR